MMDAYAHYEEGERLLKDAWERDAGIDVATITLALANGHFQAAIAYAAIVEMEKQDNPPVFTTLEASVECEDCEARVEAPKLSPWQYGTIQPIEEFGEDDDLNLDA